MSMNRFAPGTEQAVARGCVCPVGDNNGGNGAYVAHDGQVSYWFSSKCRMHGMGEPVHPDTLLIPIEFTSEFTS